MAPLDHHHLGNNAGVRCQEAQYVTRRYSISRCYSGPRTLALKVPGVNTRARQPPSFTFPFLKTFSSPIKFHRNSQVRITDSSAHSRPATKRARQAKHSLAEAHGGTKLRLRPLNDPNRLVVSPQHDLLYRLEGSDICRESVAARPVEERQARPSPYSLLLFPG